MSQPHKDRVCPDLTSRHRLAVGTLYGAYQSCRPTISRDFICFHGGALYALHGFIKKTQKTPDEELTIARKMPAKGRRWLNDARAPGSPQIRPEEAQIDSVLDPE